MTDARISIAIDSGPAEQGARRVKRSLGDVSDSAKRTDSATQSLARSMRLAQQAMLALGVGFGLSSAIRTISDFEAALSGVQAVTRATNEEMVKMSDTARRLGATTRFTAGQAAEGMRFLGMAGFDATQVVAAMPAVLNLATAATLELGSAADITSNIMSGFNLEAAETNRIADALAVTAASANTDIRQMGDAMKFVGPVASALGIQMEDAAAAVGVLSNAGIQGSMAGTGLRRVLSSLANSTPKAKEAIQGLGLTMEQINPQTNELLDVVRRLSEAGLDAETAFTIFGDRGGPAILALTSQTSDLERLTTAIRGAEGAAKDMATTMQDNLRGDLLTMTSALEEVFQILGASGGTAGLRGAVQSATEAIRSLGENIQTVGAYAATAATALGTLFVVNRISAAMKSAAIAGAAYNLFLNALSAGSATATVRIIALTAATKAWGLAIRIAGGPLGLLVTVLGTAATAYYTFRDANDVAARAVEQSRQAIDELKGAVENNTIATRDDAAFALRRAEASRALTQSLIREAEAQLKLAEARAQASGEPAPWERLQGGFGAGANGEEILKRQQLRVQQLRESLNDLGGQLDVDQAVIDGVKDRLNELTAALKNAGGSTDDLAGATDKLSDAEKDARKALASYVGAAKQDIEVLKLQIAGREKEVPLLEAVYDLRRAMNRELNPEELEQIKRVVAEREKLNKTLEEQKKREDEARKAAEKAAREYERVWENAADRVQESLGDRFRNILDGNVSSMKDFSEQIVDIVKDMVSEVAAAMVFRSTIAPLMGSIQSALGLPVTMGGQGGMTVPGFGGGMINLGGVGPSAGGGLFGSIGNMFSAPGGFGGIGDFFGGLFGAGSGGFTQLATGRVAREGLASAATGAGGLGGGLSGAMAAIPVWGWIAAAAATAKSFVEGSSPGSAEGVVNTLLGPSLEEWQNDFGRSWAISADPVGVALGDLGLPSWMTFGGLAADLFGKKPSEGETFEARFEPTGAIRNVGVDNGASMATARQMADQFSAVMQAALGLTGGQFSQSWRVSRSARSGLRLDVGGGWQQFANEPDLIQQLLGASGGDSGLRNALRRSQATDLQGFATDIQALQAIQELVANDNMTELERAVKQVNDQFAELIEKSRELGYGTADLVRIRNEEIAAVRERDRQARELETLGVEQDVLTRLGEAGAQITSFMTAYQLSGQSSLNPTQRLSLAEQEFETLLSAVEGGNLGAIGALNQSASTFLGFAREQFASSSGFTNIESRVFEALQGVRSDILSEQNINDTLQSELELTRLSQVEVGERLEAAIREEIQALRQDINQLRISGEAA